MIKINIKDIELNQEDLVLFLSVFKTTKNECNFLTDAIMEQGTFKDKEELEKEVMLTRMYNKINV